MNTSHIPSLREAPAQIFADGHGADTVPGVLVRLTSTKWLLRETKPGGDTTVAGFIHFHHGRYELIRLNGPLTRESFTSIRDAVRAFGVSQNSIQ